jgi:hypothetical protein
VSLSSGAGELDGSARGNDNQALTVESWRIGVIVGNDTHSLNRNTLGLQLSTAGSRRVSVAPIQSPGVWVDPEVTTVSVLRDLSTAGLAGILPQILTDHGLGNSLDHAGIRVRSKPGRIHAHFARTDVESGVKLRNKRGNR